MCFARSASERIWPIHPSASVWDVSTRIEEIDYTIKKVIEIVTKLREMSPLYEMAKEGVDLKSVQWAAH